MSSTSLNVSSGSHHATINNSNHSHKKKNAERYRSDFGLDRNDFGLNGQDFGLAQLTQLNKQIQAQEAERRRSISSTTNIVTSTAPEHATMMNGATTMMNGASTCTPTMMNGHGNHNNQRRHSSTSTSHPPITPRPQPAAAPTPLHVQPPVAPPPTEQLMASKETLEGFADDVATLWCGFGGIPVLDEPPSTLTFLRDYVSRSRPCIIRNALMVRDDFHEHSNAGTRSSSGSNRRTDPSHLTLVSPTSAIHSHNNHHHRNHNNHHHHHHNGYGNSNFTRNTDTRPLHLSLDDLVDMDPDQEVVVDATPDGHGDCVRTVMDHETEKVHRLFVTPEQRRMTMSEFRKQLRQGRRKMIQEKEKKSKSNSDKQEANNNHNNNTNSNRSMGNSSRYESDSDDGLVDNDEDDEEDEEEPEKELYEELDGKRIYGLKGTQKSPRKSVTTGVDEIDDILDGCGAPMAAGAGAAAGAINFSCNPIDDMQDMINSMPFFTELMDGSNNKEQEGFEVAPEPPPPPPKAPPPPLSVLYYSRQNDCFRNELPAIYEATRHVIPESLPFAEEAFGTGPPEAINLWMGDERAVSSMHKDPYENMFYVASGEKIFTLCPPADAPYLYEKDFLTGSFDSQPPKNKKSSKRSKQASSSVFQSSTACTTPQKPPKRKWTIQTDFHNKKSNNGGEDGQNDSDDDDDDDDIRLNHNLHSPQLINHNHSGIDIEPMCPEAAIDNTDKTGTNELRPAYVRWIEADVAALADARCEREQMRKFPLLKYAHPIRQVRVQAGELLYLPALWFHRVTQSRETVGLNWWYNMQFCSPQWCYFQLMSKLQPRVPGGFSSAGTSPNQSPLFANNNNANNNNNNGDYNDDDDVNDRRQGRRLPSNLRVNSLVDACAEDPNMRFPANFPTSTQAAEAFINTSQAAGATIRGVIGTMRKNWE